MLKRKIGNHEVINEKVNSFFIILVMYDIINIQIFFLTGSAQLLVNCDFCASVYHMNMYVFLIHLQAWQHSSPCLPFMSNFWIIL